MSTLLSNQAFDTALIALIVALTAFVRQRIGEVKQGAQIDAVARAQEKTGAGGTSTQVVNVPPAGAGRSPLPAPVWNQLDDPLPDAQQDPFATTNCGEESVAMAISACGGPTLPAGVLRMLLGGPGRPGTSTGTQLVWLLSLFNIRSHVRQADPDTAWIEWGHSYAARFLVIALGYWVTPDVLHWVLLRECDGASITVNDPWGGRMRVLTKEEALKVYAGTYVHIDQTISAPAPPPPRQ